MSNLELLVRALRLRNKVAGISGEKVLVVETSIETSIMDVIRDGIARGMADRPRNRVRKVYLHGDLITVWLSPVWVADDYQAEHVLVGLSDGEVIHVTSFAKGKINGTMALFELSHPDSLDELAEYLRAFGVPMDY